MHFWCEIQIKMAPVPVQCMLDFALWLNLDSGRGSKTIEGRKNRNPNSIKNQNPKYDL